jgi:M6 family metalloprotease-like protein/uncharacterized repeat protein (TIGR01451 family)
MSRQVRGCAASWQRVVAVSFLLALLFWGSTARLLAQDEAGTFAGTLEVVWGDMLVGGRVQATDVAVTLVTDEGQRLPLALAPEQLAASGGLSALQGAKVTVRGQLSTAGALQAQAIEWMAGPAAGSGSAGVYGSKPWIVLLCRGDGAAIIHEQPLPYYNALMGSELYGADHYWRETSYNKANVAGSSALGWLPLPEPSIAYQEFFLGGITINRPKSLQDCTAAADPYVDFSRYAGIALFVPVPPVTSGGVWFFGGGIITELDGPRRFMSVVWMPTEIGESQEFVTVGADILIHEMGHGFGLPHSSGPYNETYDSAWDVMSMSGGLSCYRADSPFGCTPQNTISAHKERLGWLEASQIVTVTESGAVEVVLNRLARPAGSGPLMIKAPIGDTQRFYTVEAREFAGYDKVLHAEAVIIHEVDPTGRDRPARVVDPDGNGNPNDEGAQWVPGERFDGEAGLTVCIKGRTPDGFLVAAGRNATADCTFTPDLSPSTWQAETIYPTNGQTVTMKIELINYQAPATNTVVTATIPNATAYVSKTATTSQGTVELARPNQLVFRAGELSYREPIYLQYDVVVKSSITKPTLITHRVDIVCDQGAKTLRQQWIANPLRMFMPMLAR